MKRFLPIGIILLFFLLFSPCLVLAEDNTTVNNAQVQAKSAGGIFDWLINLVNSLKKNHTGDTIEKVARSKTPDLNFVPIDSSLNVTKDQASVLSETETEQPSTVDTKEIDTAASYYSVANAAGKPADPQKPVTNFITDLFSKLFGKPSTEEVIMEGDKQAREYEVAILPAPIAANVQEQAFNISNQTVANGMNTDETKVLGTQKKNKSLMEESLIARQCALLPQSVGENLDCPVFTASALSERPTQTPIETTPIPQVSGIPVSGSCEEGTGYCSVDYLHKPDLFSDISAARIASMICQRESGGDPSIPNDGCLTGKSHEYSIGLFQINIIYHLNALIDEMGIISGDCRNIIIDNWETDRRCVIPDLDKFNTCIAPLKDPNNNIRYAVSRSINGTNWDPWSTAQGCDLTAPTPIPATGEYTRVPDTDLYLQDFNDGIIRPSQIVIHWSGSWSSARVTADYIRYKTPYSCHLATDQNTQLQLLKYFPASSQKAWCVGGNDNNTALNNEISGLKFDEIVGNPNHPRYQELMKETDKAIASTCWMLNFYHITKTQVFGHFETKGGKEVGKPDPGPVYMQYFRQRINTECP